MLYKVCETFSVILHNYQHVWKCGYDCFSKYFLLENALKYIFLKKIIFDISALKWSENTKKY